MEENLGHSHLRLRLLLLEELLQKLHLVLAGQRRPWAPSWGLRGARGEEHPGRGRQHGFLGVG